MTQVALVAQWIEHLTTDQKVVGSTPAECANVRSITADATFDKANVFLTRATITFTAAHKFDLKVSTCDNVLIDVHEAGNRLHPEHCEWDYCESPGQSDSCNS